MKKQSKQQFEKFVVEIIKEYLPKLLITRHTVGIVQDKKTSFMALQFMEPYLSTDILYNPERVLNHWETGDREELRRGVIHELCHVITDPFYEAANSRYTSQHAIDNERERLTDHIAMIVQKNNI